mgnify:CR=1 FL=1
MYMNFLTDTIEDKLSELVQNTRKNALRHLALAEKWKALHKNSRFGEAKTFCSKCIASNMLQAERYFTRMRELQVRLSLRNRSK